MKNYDHDFYVTLFSNDSQDLYPDNTIAAFTTKLAHPIVLGSSGLWEVGLCELACPASDQRTFTKETEPVVVGASHAFVYCNIIAPQIIGDSFVRCLRTYSLSPKPFQQAFKAIYYVPLEHNTIHNIRIEVLTREGSRVLFNDSSTPLRLVLHFRRVSHCI